MEGPDKQVLIDIVTKKMPFGKYGGRIYSDLPISYLEWFNKKGWPEGKVGFYLANVYEIKINGMEPLLRKIKFVVNK